MLHVFEQRVFRLERLRQPDDEQTILFQEVVHPTLKERLAGEIKIHQDIAAEHDVHPLTKWDLCAVEIEPAQDDIASKFFAETEALVRDVELFEVSSAERGGELAHRLR